jgi:uncharacterized protein (DUF111 family)
LLQILSPPACVESLSTIVFQETTTIGIRRHEACRSILERDWTPVETDYGTVPIKVARLNGRIVNFAPEYEDCVRLARENKIALKQVQAQAIQRFLEKGT